MQYMEEALKLAQRAANLSEIPVGAVIVHQKTGHIIAKAHNMVEKDNNATYHAEILAINQACEYLGSKYLTECDLYVTLEPCSMCAAAISLARIRRLYFGAYDIKSGGVEHGPRLYSFSTMHHKPEVIGGVIEEKCGQIMTQFFEGKRRQL